MVPDGVGRHFQFSVGIRSEMVGLVELHVFSPALTGPIPSFLYVGRVTRLWIWSYLKWIVCCHCYRLQSSTLETLNIYNTSLTGVIPQEVCPTTLVSVTIVLMARGSSCLTTAYFLGKYRCAIEWAPW
jgi:hypothetical protein